MERKHSGRLLGSIDGARPVIGVLMVSRDAMRIIPTRPRRPYFPPELIAELDLIGLQELRRLRYMAGNPGEGVAEIRLLRRFIGRGMLEDWIA